MKKVFRTNEEFFKYFLKNKDKMKNIVIKLDSFNNILLFYNKITL